MKSAQLKSGFTLIELAITTAIIAILAVSATTIYTCYVRKIRRAEAISDILAIQIAEEKYRTINTTYGSITQVWNKITTDSGFYNLHVTGNSATAYTIIATALGNQTIDRENHTPCNILSLSVNNGVEAKTPNDCWE